ncbi:MAG TPA: alternative ribosome rescue aminoacyl-tRNA hydrolase ArfB [Gemmatimonadales bacterium]|nr:alternative ribosome rescue aminoacyl-tRNA hydrolase ArfB [Gemmatimonadales bacterium]
MDDERLGVRITPRLIIPWAELEFRASRAGGPGGQHVNTSSTRIEVAWSVATSQVLEEDQRARLRHRLESRLSSRGVLRLVASSRRSQSQNKEEVIGRLAQVVSAALVVPRKRVATKPSRGAKEARLEAKKTRAATKRLRRPVRGDD